MYRPSISLFSYLRCAIFVTFSGLLCGSILLGQAPLNNSKDLSLESEQRLVLGWQIEAAEATLQSGLVVTAEGLFRSLLEASGLSAELTATLQLRLAGSLIGQRRFNAAQETLELVGEDFRASTYFLYRAVTIYGDGKGLDPDDLLDVLKKVDSTELSKKDLPWLYLIQGLASEKKDGGAATRNLFERARSEAVSELQRSYFDSLVLREELFDTPSSEELAAEIRQKLEQYRGLPAEFNFVREYAVILHNLDRNGEAIRIIDQSIDENRSYSKREYEQLRLLKGVILGADSQQGLATLQSVIRSGTDRKVMSIALQMLTHANDPKDSKLRQFLDDMIGRPAQHTLLSQFYYIRSQLSLVDSGTAEDEIKREQYVAQAEKDARILLEQFPGFGAITSVYRLLAYAALNRDPPQYRAAADFLIQLRDQTEKPASRWELNRLIGDCYFLNGDYANSVDFYKAARAVDTGIRADDEVFLRLITAEVRSGDLESAKQHIDQADFSGKIDAPDRWRAEWNLAQALQARGDVEGALTRVKSLLNDNRASSIDAALDLRLGWLAARLALISGQIDGLSEQVEVLLQRIVSLPEGKLRKEESGLLRTEILLLQADVKIRNGETEAAIVLLEALRNEYPVSSAAVRSYLTEASYYASIDDLQIAQERLTSLASNYPESELAPQALYEAALYCEARGPGSFAEAIRLHDELAQRYPNDALMLPARLKQGDLLRLMNDFAGAQIIYENLINRFPEHPRRYVAELSKADCLLALAKDNIVQLDGVVATLERLMDMPNLPIDFQAEAGYKWGFALQQREESEKATEVLSLLIGRLLLESSTASKLGTTGRYWISRSLLDLGQLHELSGRSDEARLIYQKILAFNLPGRNLAEGKLSSL